MQNLFRFFNEKSRMPYMQMNLIKKHGAIYLFLLFLIYPPIEDVESSPWATPDDVLVKHDLQILSDAGY